MTYPSLADFLKAKHRCPLCKESLLFDFETVDDKAYVSYSLRGQDVSMRINCSTNRVSYIAFKEPRNELANLMRENNIFHGHCKNREQSSDEYNFNENYEYNVTFALNLDERETNVLSVEMLQEKFFIVDENTIYHISLDLKNKQTSIYYQKAINQEKIATIPSTLIDTDKTFDRDTLIRKIRAISILS